MELNPFENSFAKKDLLLLLQPRTHTFPDSASASGTSTQSLHTNNEQLLTSGGDKSSTTAVEPESKTANAADAAASVVKDSAAPVSATSGVANGTSNRHNLRILNFLSLDTERLPGLTPPIFTPGGRRLPPIQFSPGAALGSPGTPGHMWSSLLSATNGSHTGSEANPQFASMLRKLGLTPNESNLRSGLTPSIMAQQGFNFNLNTPGGFPHGQMTPGLLNLLGLTSSAPTDVPANPAAPVYPEHPLPAATVPKVNEPKPDQPIQEEEASDDSGDEAVVKKEQLGTVKRSASENGRGTKRAKAAPKGRATKKKEELKKSARVNSEDEKRKQFLERNRVAASKCRQRKKQLFSKMESELSYYSNGYRELSAQVTQLREQLLQLKGILINHRDCPGLVNSVGGYQQMQNVLGQTDYIAQVAANAQPNYTSIPTTIPTTLNSQPVKTESPVNGGVTNVDVHPMPDMNHVNGQLNGQVGEIGGVRAPPTQVPNLNGYQGDVEAGYQGDISQNGLNDQGGPLRSINSASNLQNDKLRNDSYGLRPVASMADLQNVAQQNVMKHFEV